MAMQEEYNAFVKNRTQTLVKLPIDKKSVGNKWVFKIKRNSNGSVSKYKARLVAKCFLQKTGFEFTKTFSPVVKPDKLI